MIEQNARQTKVIKSYEGGALTPARAEQAALEDVDIVRLVYSPQTTGPLLEFVKTLAKQKTPRGRRPVMLDLANLVQGTITALKEPREVAFGEVLTFSAVGGPGPIFIASENWSKLWAPNAKVFIGSGQVGLKTKRIADDRVELEVTQGGTIFPDMDVYIPETRRDAGGVVVSASELKPLIDAGVDYLIVPGQWQPAKISQFKSQLLQAHGDETPWLLVKVDSEHIVARLEDFLKEVEGVLISRRELALTTNPATVPMMTKEIVQLCADHAKVVATASEMLASMRRNVTPTRAEVSDIANAVLDGTDAVVLSEEVANGKYGSQAVAVTQRIIRDIEDARKVKPNWIRSAPAVANEMDAIAYHAYKTAERLKAKAIVCVTKAGNTALKLSSFRIPIPVIAVTFSPAVMRRMSIVRGVEGLLVDVAPNLDEVLPLVNDQLVRGSWLKAGDPIIFVSITLSPIGKDASNLFTIQKLT